MTSGLERPASLAPAESRESRWARWLFVAVEAGAFVFYLSLAHTQWFFADEWEFLSARGVNAHDLLRVHYGHWVAVPIVVYRLLWAVVGLRSYLPYVGLAIALHLTAAALLWAIMRRAGVRAITATVAASAFALFGAGAQDILWAFQITFSGALVLGLGQLLLADHDGPLDRRDALGVVCGLLALMCSGVAVTMVVVVGLATLVRRGWRVAVVHVAPLGAIYGAWWLRYSRGDNSFVGNVRQVVAWCFAGIDGVFGALAQVPGLGWVLGALLVGGCVLVLRTTDRATLRRELVLPGALLAGVIVFLVVAGIDRGALGAAPAKLSRYLDIDAALALPAIGVAIDALLRRAVALGAIGLAVLVVGIPGNISKANDFARHQRLVDGVTRQLVLSVPRDPLARRVPATLRPEPNRAPTVMLGWLLAGVASGRIPTTRPPTPIEARTNRLRLSLMELDRRSPFRCHPLTAPVQVQLAPGERLGIGGSLAVALVTGPALASSPVSFGNGLLNPTFSHTLVAVAGPLTLRIAPEPFGPRGIFGPALCPGPTS